MIKALRFVLAAFCLLGFMVIRFRESEFFYDPLINYFHGDYQNMELPLLDRRRFFLSIFLRYFLNMLLSIVLLWAVFADKQILKFATFFYVVLFVILLVVFYLLLQDYNSKEYLPLFYVRRFLIQPLVVFLLVPAFFYARKVNT